MLRYDFEIVPNRAGGSNVVVAVPNPDVDISGLKFSVAASSETFTPDEILAKDFEGLEFAAPMLLRLFQNRVKRGLSDVVSKQSQLVLS